MKKFSDRNSRATVCFAFFVIFDEAILCVPFFSQNIYVSNMKIKTSYLPSILNYDLFKAYLKDRRYASLKIQRI